MNINRPQGNILRILAAIVLAIAAARMPSHSAECNECGTACNITFAIKTDLIHDALLTPDIGIEMSVARRWSLSAQGLYAWWSKSDKNFYWRIRGSSIELRHWFGHKPLIRALSGHHIGIYGSIHDYDFEFGHTGYQASKPTFGIGASYGYSLRISNRLNIDFSMRIGYAAGKQTKYHPECGTYVCDSHRTLRYFGPTGISISLVWFPGKGHFNRPTYADI